jgi:diadenylate cyclase
VNQYLTWILQALILSTGIYFFLRFLRTTRGSGLFRGLVVAVLFGFVFLWGLAKVLHLEELEHIFQSVTGYVVVILAILFQPELRRGITQLGEHQLMGRILAKRRQETVNEVVQAAIAMASRRHGALVAFERDLALDAYIDNAVKIDSDVNRLLLESIFQPGGSLHDGAVVLRKDRVAAATCLFPLTENVEISKSTGTRHRAALGLTEETDAITLVVSEETGAIAVCKRGKMIQHIPPNRLEEVLREHLGTEATSQEADAERGRPDRAKALRTGLKSFFTKDVVRKLASLSLAAALLFVANQNITKTRTVSLQVVVEDPNHPGPGTTGTLVVRLPGIDYNLLEPKPRKHVDVRISGTRAQLEAIDQRFYGILTVAQSDSEIRKNFPLEDVRWIHGGTGGSRDLNVRWNGDQAPDLVIERYQSRNLQLKNEHVIVDTSQLDSRFEAQTAGMTFDPTSIRISGPQGVIEKLDSGDLSFALEPLVLGPGQTTDRSVDLPLSEALLELSLSIDGSPTVTVKLEIIPSRKDAGTVDRDIQITHALQPWSLPPTHRQATFRIWTRGLLPDNEAVSAEVTQAVRNYVSDNLTVLVNASQITEEGSTVVPLQWTVMGDWREAFSAADPVDERADLWVELIESEPKVVRLVPD